MCGICGVAGNLSSEDVKAFQLLLFVSSLRGDHSTGVATILADSRKRREHIKLKKEALSSPDYLEKHKHPKNSREIFFSAASRDILMGHCRYATVGKVNDENAHPFETKTLIGTHNGTLYNQELNKPGKTDSQQMFEKMDKIGIDATLDSLSPKSAYAVAIYEKQSEALTLARNSERPLFVGICKEKDVLYYASEAAFLRFIADKCNIKMSIFYLVTYTRYTIPLSEIKAGNNTPWDTEDLIDKKGMTDPEYNSSTAGIWTDADWQQYIDYQDQKSTKSGRYLPIGYGDEYDPAEMYPDDDEYTSNTSPSSNPNLTKVGDQQIKTPKSWDLDCDGCGGTIPLAEIGDARTDFEGGSVYLCEDCQVSTMKDPHRIYKDKIKLKEEKDAA